MIETKCFIFISRAIFYAIRAKDIDKQRKQEVEQMALCRKAFVFFDLSVASCYLFNSFNSCAWLLFFFLLYLYFQEKSYCIWWTSTFICVGWTIRCCWFFFVKCLIQFRNLGPLFPDYVTPTSQNFKLFLNIYVKNGRGGQHLKFNLIAFVKV